MIRAILLRHYSTKLLCFIVLILNVTVFQATITAQIQGLFQENILKQYGAEEGVFIGGFTEIIQDQEGYIWMSGTSGLCRFDGYEFYQFPNDPDVLQSINTEGVADVFEDSQQNLWVGTTRDGLKLLDRKKGKFIDFASANDDLRFKSALEVIEDETGQIWVCSTSGLGKVNQAKRVIEYFPLPDFKRAPHIMGAVLAKSNKLWIGTTNTELLEVDLKTGATRFIQLPFQESLKNSTRRIWIRKLFIDAKDRLWLSADNGVFRAEMADLNSKAEVEWTFMHPTPTRGILADENDNLWMATRLGLLYYNMEKETFDPNYLKARGLEELNKMDIRKIFLDKQQNLWIADEVGIFYHLLWNQPKAKLYPNEIFDNGESRPITALEMAGDEVYFGKKTGTLGRFNVYTHREEILLKIPNPTERPSANKINIIHKDQDNQLWIGTQSRGIWIYQIDSKQLLSLEQYLGKPQEFIPQTVQYMTEDKDGRILISCTRHGLIQCDPKNKSIKQLDCKEAIDSRCILEKIVQSKTEAIWMLGYYERTKILKFTPSSDSYRLFDIQGEAEQVTDVSTIFEDRDGHFWIGTDKGLFKLNEEQDKFIHYGRENGLPENKVLAIQQDAQGKLWVSSDQGVYTLDPANNLCNPLDTYIRSSAFQANRNVVHQETQQLFSATAKGLWVINLSQISNIDNQTYHTTFSKASYYYTNGEAPKVDVLISEKSSIKVPHQIVSIEFQLSTLDYTSSEQINYKYALQRKGWFSKPIKQRDWIDLKKKKQINLTGLSAGRYILNVKASTQLGHWDAESTQLRIHRLPPWWLSDWAYAIYASLLGFLVYQFYRYQLSRQYLYQEAVKLKEMDEFKSRFFTDISHEFRTPLTIIVGMADQINNKPDFWVSRGTKMIRNNARNLLQLVNQILDLRKLESSTLPLNWIQGDIIPHLRYIAAAHASLAESKGVNLSINIFEGQLIMDYDPDKLMKIISNLLSNAIKFTDTNDTITLSAFPNKKQLQITVQDTGIGIPKEQITHIFDRFYKINHPNNPNPQGSGIGLALTKELVKLLGGTIQAESEIGKGTCFTVALPITRQAPKEEVTSTYFTSTVTEEEIATILPSVTKEDQTEDLPKLLIVEDNKDMVQFLVACLSTHYQLEIAFDGAAGIAKAIEQVPDLIVSDVMMPKKDGLELCDTLKKDERTSHIPIVLLTAKADLESRLSGLEKGADVYLAKPFEERELLIRLEKLLELRKQLQKHYSGSETGDEKITKGEVVEDAFLQKLRVLIHENISSTTLNVKDLSQELHMSYTQVYRKVKALTGKTPSLWIRHIRLQEAQRLLQTTDLTITEIAYEVGFSTPSYFSRAYTEEFKISPTKYRKQFIIR